MDVRVATKQQILEINLPVGPLKKVLFPKK
jgi:hypothetical protein